MERADDLGGGYRLLQNTDEFCFGTDSLLLSRFAHVQPGERVVDLCAGNGAVSVLLCARHADITVTGLELQQSAHALAVRSAALNGLEHRLTFLHGDIRDIASLLPPACADVVVCNPPYRHAAAGRVNPKSAKAIARFELCMTLSDVFAAAAHVLTQNGRLCLVHLPDRLGDCLCGMRAHGLEPKRVQAVHPTPQKNAAWILMEAVNGGKLGLECAPPIILNQEGLI